MLQAAVGEGQQRSIQGALGVLQDGIVLVDVLHYLRVELILLKYRRDKKKKNAIVTITNFDISAANSQPKANQRVGDGGCLSVRQG